MRERIDPLIQERAPWVYRPGAHIRIARGLLHLLLGYDECISRAEEIKHMPADQLMDALAESIALNVDVKGVEQVPDSGPAMVVCNHPTGIADGIILWSVLRKRRPDLFFFANRDAIRVMPQLDAMIAPVEWRVEKRSWPGWRASTSCRWCRCISRRGTRRCSTCSTRCTRRCAT